MIFPTPTCIPTLAPTLMLTMIPTTIPTLQPTMTLTCKPMNEAATKGKRPARPKSGKKKK